MKFKNFFYIKALKLISHIYEMNHLYFIFLNMQKWNIYINNQNVVPFAQDVPKERPKLQKEINQQQLH